MSSDSEDPPTPASEKDSPTREETTPSIASQIRKPDVDFAFGPQNWYWARLGGRWRSVRSPASIWKSYGGIEEPYWMAFKHDVGEFIGGCHDDGDGHVTYTSNEGYMIRAGDVDSFIESQKAYAKLYDWITERVGSDIEKVRNVSISIGPKGSYFARCGTSHTHIAHALPKDLQTAIEESESPPLCIALGIKGAWILLRADGSRTWNLRQAYPGLASTDRLTDDSNPVVFAALSPFHENRYFLVTESGGCTYNTNTSDREEGERLHHLTDSYMRMRARKDGSTFTHSMTLNGVPRQVVITPKSAPDETKTDAWIAMLRARQKYLGRKDLAFAGAVAGGTGVLAKVVRMPTWRAVGVAASTGFGAGVAMWFREE